MEFGHIGIRVINIEASMKFYVELLGCKILKDYSYPEMRIVFLEAHGTVVELIYKASNKSRGYGPVEHIAFKVESLDREIDKLKNFGITDISDPKIVGKGRLIFFDGPNNERIEFVEKIG